jgi:hydroxyethylthiazole kinase-like uncharacterized protein yjeF
MKIFSSDQTRQLDAYTIQHEPIPSIDLMERASATFTSWFCTQFSGLNQTVAIFCGPGNNGGDGLAVARMLLHRGYSVEVFVLKIGNSVSDDHRINRRRLDDLRGISVKEVQKEDAFPDLSGATLLIDAIFGSGLSRPVEGYWGQLIDQINQLPQPMVAIDIPSGLFADRPSAGSIIRAAHTFSFEAPKLAFFFPENAPFIGEWVVRSIGLSPVAIAQTDASHHYLISSDLSTILKHRQKFDHKGTYGHALLVVGSYGKTGAAILAAKACLRSGAGLVSVHVPRSSYTILQVAFPEAMVSVDSHEFVFTEVEDITPYRAIGVGPGIGTNKLTQQALLDLIKKSEQPLVIDADGLNILAKNPDWIDLLPANSILTPHPKEFERLFGATTNSFERLQLQMQIAQQKKIILILKGAHTCVALPNGNCYFNSTGNPGMGTGGSGDVLTGMLTGLLAQQYTPKEAALLGVYLHGSAGDIAADELEQESLLAGDIVQHIGLAFKRLKSTQT